MLTRTCILTRWRNWFAKREINGELSNSVNKVEVETSRIIKKTTLDDINHGTDYIKISQNQYTDKAVDVTVVTEEIVTQIQNAQKDSEKETLQRDLSWTPIQ